MLLFATRLSTANFGLKIFYLGVPRMLGNALFL
jgi:hypothetical protein